MQVCLMAWVLSCSGAGIALSVLCRLAAMALMRVNGGRAAEGFSDSQIMI